MERLAMPRGVGKVLGPFRMVRPLGRGGFAPVFLAEEVYDGKKLRDVALKLFLAPEGASAAETMEWRDRVLEEARALCRVEHPHVVRFYSVHRDEGGATLGLAMEYVRGESLEERLQRLGPLEPREVMEAGRQVAWALSAVHAAGLVHRDIKPANIIGGTSRYTLIDFGVVTEHGADGKPSAKGLVLGTPGYIAPECLSLSAPPSPTTDLYALGVTLFRLLTGTLPEPGRALGETAAIELEPHGVSAQSPNLVALNQARDRSPNLVALIQRLLEADHHARPRHADWVAQELTRMLDEAPRSSLPAPPIPDTTADTTTRAPLPKRPAPLAPLRTQPPLVGRDDALDVLAQAALAATQGQLRVVLFSGPPGVGRTSLLDAALERAGFAPGRALRAQASPERKSLLRPLTRALERLPPEHARALSALEEAIEDAIAPQALPGASRGEAELESVEEALLWIASREPLLLTLDDLQWADAYTLDLLRLLCERAATGGTARLLVVAAVREEPHPSAPLRALLSRVRLMKSSRAVRHLPLGPLSAEHAAVLAQSIGPLAPELERAVVRASGRMPFFLVHAVHAWRETGAIVQRDGVFVPAKPSDEGALLEGLPGVADLLEARLGACFEPESADDRAARRALAAIALHGSGLRMEMLLAATGDAERVEAALDALLGLGLLSVAGDRQEYSFPLEMMRQAALNLTRARPWFFRLHRALLDAIERGPDANAEAAFLATGYDKLGATAEARRWLGRAMENAAMAGLFGEAADLGERLAALTDERRARTRIKLEIVRALVLGRRFAEARARIDALEAEDPAPSMLDAALGLRCRIYRAQVGRGLQERGGGDATLVADADAHGDPALRCEARMALAGVADGAHALVLAGEAVELAAAARLPTEFAARVLRVELVYASNERDLALAERDLRRALALARAASSAWQEVHIEGDLAVIEAERGFLDEAIERLRRLTARAEELGMRGQMRLSSHNLATCLMRAGRAAEAAETSKRTAALSAEMGDPVLRAVALSLRALALRQTGALEEALADASEAASIQRARDDVMLAQTLLHRAEALLALGQREQALTSARAAREVAERHGENSYRVTAVLWEVFCLAQQGQAPREELLRAVAEAEASGVARRALLRSLIEQASAWLAKTPVA